MALYTGFCVLVLWYRGSMAPIWSSVFLIFRPLGICPCPVWSKRTNRPTFSPAPWLPEILGFSFVPLGEGNLTGADAIVIPANQRHQLTAEQKENSHSCVMAAGNRNFLHRARHNTYVFFFFCGSEQSERYNCTDIWRPETKLFGKCPTTEEKSLKTWCDSKSLPCGCVRVLWWVIYLLRECILGMPAMVSNKLVTNWRNVTAEIEVKFLVSILFNSEEFLGSVLTRMVSI